MSEKLLTDSIARSILGTKWKPRIVTVLVQNGRSGFGELQAAIGDISNKVLSSNLTDLNEYDVIAKDVIQEDPVRVEYEITRAGQELYEIIEAMSEWDTAYIDGVGLPTVLIADDDTRQLEMYSMWLSAEYDVITAEDGREALNALDESVTAAILDRSMPVLTGPEVVDALDLSGQQVPVAFLSSARASPSDVLLPVDLLLSKPIERGDLQDAVEELVRLGEASPVARDVRSRQHRLAFVRDQLGSGVKGTEPVEAAVAELEQLQAKREQDMREREPWRALANADQNLSTDGTDEKRE